MKLSLDRFFLAACLMLSLAVMVLSGCPDEPTPGEDEFLRQNCEGLNPEDRAAIPQCN